MEILLEAKNITIEYKSINKNNSLKSTVVKAVKNLSFKICKGEIYALAGESGCGKSTLAKSLVRLVKPTEGDIFINGTNIKNLNKNRGDFCKSIQMVFQNPYSSLNPKMKIKDILLEPLDINTKYSLDEKLCIIKDTISDVGLKESSLDLYPHEFSGGQRQRIAIARALILKPELLIADEPVSALDASIQAQILNLLKELKQKHDLTILFISHDMNVIKYISDRVGVMYNGSIIEENYTSTLFKYPKEEYTKNLINAIPSLKL